MRSKMKINTVTQLEAFANACATAIADLHEWARGRTLSAFDVYMDPDGDPQLVKLEAFASDDTSAEADCEWVHAEFRLPPGIPFQREDIIAALQLQSVSGADG